MYVKLNNILKVSLVAVMATLVFFETVQAQVYYVDKNHSQASDSNPGTQNLPWLTIQHAVDMVSPGDTVFVRAGVYNERVALDGSCGTEGESGNATDGYITYASYPGETAILDGNGFGWGSAFNSGLYSTSGMCGSPGPPVNYIRIVGFEIRNYSGTGIGFERSQQSLDNSVGSKFITIENNIVHDNDSYGILFDPGDEAVDGESHDIIVRNNTIYNNGGHGIKMTNGEPPGSLSRTHTRDSIVEGNTLYGNAHSGIAVSTGAYNITIRNNVSYNNGWAGIHTHQVWDSLVENNHIYDNGQSNQNQDGIILWNSKGITIRGNKVHDNNHGYGITVSGKLPGSSTGDHKIENNVIYNNAEGGISLYQSDNSTFYHNVIAVNGGNGILGSNAGPGNIFKNNIIYQNFNQISASSGSTYDYNLYYPDVSFNGKGQNALSSDPGFADPTNNNYELQSTSPAIDKATQVGVQIDIDGITRPQGSGPDIGAYEFKSDLTPPSNLKAKLIVQ